MTKIVNLNKKRKAKKKEDKEKTAVENRIKYGRTKEEKKLAEAAADIDERKLDGHELVKGEDNGPDMPNQGDEPADTENEDE